MADPLRHRQTKGAATDMVDLTPPRHISTLPRAAIRGPSRSSAALDPEPTAQTDPLQTIVFLNGDDGPRPTPPPIFAGMGGHYR